MLIIQPMSFNKTGLNSQNKYAFRANPIRKIKVTPETAVQLSIAASLSGFFAKFFAEDVRKNTDRKSTQEEISLALELEMIKKMDVDNLVNSISEEEFQNSVKFARKNGFIIEDREDLKMFFKDADKRTRDEYWMEKGMQYWEGLSSRIDAEEISDRDSEFLEGMAEAKEKNFENEFNKFEVIG